MHIVTVSCDLTDVIISFVHRLPGTRNIRTDLNRMSEHLDPINKSLFALDVTKFVYSGDWTEKVGLSEQFRQTHII